MLQVQTSREKIWNTLVSRELSCPLTAESGNCRNKHGKHWAAFSWLDVSAISQHTWRYGRPISITYTRQTNQHQVQHTWWYGRPISITYTWQTNQHHLYTTDQSALGAAHVTVRQTNQHHLYTTDQSATSTVKHYFHMHQMFAIWVGLRN